MEGMLYSILAAVILAVLGWVAGRLSLKTKVQEKSEETCDRVAELEQAQKDTHELVKLSLRMIILLGDGIVQSGVNGEVKKAFEKMKQEVLQKL